jgi:hypothetical protein
MRSLLMLHVYPMERFWIDGREEWHNNHNLSLRRFQAYLGLSFTHERSGDSSASRGQVKKKWHGSDLVRCHLYPHALTMICHPKIQAQSEAMAKLKKVWFEPRFNPSMGLTLPSFKSLGKDGICRLLFYETRLLYSELKKAVRNS